MLDFYKEKGRKAKTEEKFLNYGLNLLKKIIKFSFDKEGFPKSRNIRQLNFYLKYFVLIREWLKESQNEIPEYINENVVKVITKESYWPFTGIFI